MEIPCNYTKDEHLLKPPQGQILTVPVMAGNKIGEKLPFQPTQRRAALSIKIKNLQSIQAIGRPIKNMLVVLPRTLHRGVNSTEVIIIQVRREATIYDNYYVNTLFFTMVMIIYHYVQRIVGFFLPLIFCITYTIMKKIISGEPCNRQIKK